MSNTSDYETDLGRPAHLRTTESHDVSTRIPLPNSGYTFTIHSDTRKNNTVSYRRINYSSQELRSAYKKMNRMLGE